MTRATDSSRVGLRRHAAHWIEMSGYGEVLHDGGEAFEARYGQDEDSLVELLARVRRETIEECINVVDDMNAETDAGNRVLDAAFAALRALATRSSCVGPKEEP